MFDSSNVSIVFVYSLADGSWFIVFVEFVMLVIDDSSNVVMCRLLVVWLDVLVVCVMYVSMYEGRANYQYYALQGSE